MTHENLQVPIERGGGKLEMTKALADKGFPVPTSEYLYYPDLDKPSLVEACFNSFSSPIIVRGSHQNDMDGYIDVLPTHRNVTSLEELQRAIQDIKRTAASEALAIHAADWGQPFTPEVHVLVQEQSPSTIAGSMLRHPHMTDDVVVNYVDVEERTRSHESIFSYRPNFSYAKRERGHLYHEPWLLDISDEQVEETLALYEEIEKSDLVNQDYVYQMEFGFDPLMVYQLRPFRKKEPAQNFRLPRTYGLPFPAISADIAFGITPPEGVEVDMVPVDFTDFWHGATQGLETKPYGLLFTSKVVDTYPPSRRLGNLVCAALKDSGYTYLEHGDYRFLKRAQYALAEYYPNSLDLNRYDGTQEKFYSAFRESRLWSNGEDAVIIPAEHVAKL